MTRRPTRRRIEKRLAELADGTGDLTPAQQAARVAVREASAADPIGAFRLAPADRALVTIHESETGDGTAPETHVWVAESPHYRWFVAPEYVPDDHADDLPVALPESPVPVADFTTPRS